MKKEKIFFYDTTLRDGQQTQGVNFSVDDKMTISKALDSLGIDYIEGGWPGSNPTDSKFFSSLPALDNSVITAFGMTKRNGISAENDDLLSELINSDVSEICIVGKSNEYHVENALQITLDENILNIKETVKRIKKNNKKVIFDAEHFFDGFKLNPDYSIKSIFTALESGAECIVLCDTNGGTLPFETFSIVKKVINLGIPRNKIGIHAHNDTGNGVANSLAAVDAGARHIQGTINGLGERCGNADLISIIPTIILKEPYSSKFKTNITKKSLTDLTKISRLVDDILNRIPSLSAPYVGPSAFSHKAGLHANAVMKMPETYEHINPKTVGNLRKIPISNQAGKSNLIDRLKNAKINWVGKEDQLINILNEIKIKEEEGFSYDNASASFELLARRVLNEIPKFFEVKRYKVTSEKRKNRYNKMVNFSEAVVVLRIGEKKVLSVSESVDEYGKDRGPINALSKAISKDLGPYQSTIDDIKLVDYKVRITSGGVGAVTRVLIDSEDSNGKRWSTVGVSTNIVDASFQALLDSILWKLCEEEVKPV